MIRITLKGISEQTLSWGYLLVELSLARLFNSHWHSSSTVTDTIVQQSLEQLCKCGWHDSSTVTAKSFLFSVLVEFFNSDVHCWRIVPCARNTTHDSISYQQIKTKNFCILIVSLCMCIACHFQSTQNTKFAISL